MGQYYRPCFINDTKDNVLEFFSPYDTDNGAKLMEHSYVGNALVLNVTHKMIYSPKRLVWAGDYADEVVGEDNFFYLTYKADKAEPFGEIDKVKRALDMYGIYINHDKKEWFDLKKQTIPDMKDWGGIVHPLPILTADGNGRGGGDYDGALMEMVGTWKGDLIEVSDTIPADYKEIEPWFTEMPQEEIDKYLKDLKSPADYNETDEDEALKDADDFIKTLENGKKEDEAKQNGLNFLLDQWETDKKWFREQSGHVTTEDVIKRTFEFAWASKRNFDYQQNNNEN